MSRRDGPRSRATLRVGGSALWRSHELDRTPPDLGDGQLYVNAASYATASMGHAQQDSSLEESSRVIVLEELAGTAIDLLRKGAELGLPQPSVLTGPHFEALRGDPRFDEILSSLDL